MAESGGKTGGGGNVEPQSGGERKPALFDPLNAPIIFFEAPASVRHFDGVFTLALASTKVVPMNDGKSDTAPVAAVFLKTTRSGLAGLRKIIDDAFLLAAETEGSAN